MRILRDPIDEIKALRREVQQLKNDVIRRLPPSDYQSYTPTLTAATTNPTLGTGGFTRGKYIQIGRVVMYHFYFQFGTSGTNAGSGEYHVSLPLQADFIYSSAALFGGSGVIQDWSVAGHKELFVPEIANSATYLRMNIDNALVFHNNPMAWTVDDRCGGSVFYPVPSA